MSEHVVSLDETNFDTTVEDKSTPVLVDFWAEWCGPCRALAPVIEELAEEYAGKIRFAKLNVDESREVAMRFGISGIPTMILFKDGKKLNQMSGNQPRDRIKGLLDTAL